MAGRPAAPTLRVVDQPDGSQRSRWLPPRADVVLAGVFLALALAQIAVQPIAGPVASVSVALGSTVPLAWRHVAPATAALAGSVIWLVPTEGFLLLGYVVAALLFFSVGTEVSSWW